MDNNWLATLKKSKKSCMQDGNLRKVHYDLPNGEEMVEEYNMDTGVINRRAWKIKKELGGEGEWLIEVGDPIPTLVGATGKGDLLIKESSTQPLVSFRITKRSLEWRIRNLPYPANCYQVSVDNNNARIIVSTTNKKYYKVLHIPVFERLHLQPQQKCIEFSHKFNTLIITHSKPEQLINFENELFDEVKALKVKNEGDLDCKPS